MSRFTLNIWCGGFYTSDVDTTLDLPEHYGIDDVEAVIDEWCADGDFSNDEGDDVEVLIRWTVLDEEGNDMESGKHTVQIPHNERLKIKLAGGDPDCSHEWEPDESVGCKENPGVMGLGGTALSVTEWCTLCRIIRNTRYNGSQRDPGQPKIEVSYAWYLEDDKEYQRKLTQERSGDNEI